ncbi:MAG: glycosyltransferase [Clostridia bacterium]|nr:glycosyltransferase [Clostridia bacterium]
MDRIAVLVPCYNEAQTIEKVVSDWKTALPEAVVYVYDNNSTDDTAAIARAAGAIVRSEPQQGKGNVVRSMFQDIDAECYIMVDGDDTYPADAGPAMAKEVLENGIDMVIGDRLSSTYFTENKRPFHGFGNSLVRFSINRMFHSNVRDVMTGLRAMSYRFAKSFPVVSQGFEIETEMTIHAIDKNMALKNEIIEYRDRPEGSESKLNTVSDGLKVLRTILRLYVDYKPFQFFGIIALILIALAVGFFIPVFSDYLHTGLVERFPTLIVCGFSAISGIISLFTGLILSTLKNRERREFEFRLQSIAQWKTAK